MTTFSVHIRREEFCPTALVMKKKKKGKITLSRLQYFVSLKSLNKNKQTNKKI